MLAEADHPTALEAVPFLAKVLRKAAADVDATGKLKIVSLFAVFLPEKDDVTIFHVRALMETLEMASRIVRVYT
jgi:hypothetical protein